MGQYNYDSYNQHLYAQQPSAVSQPETTLQSNNSYYTQTTQVSSQPSYINPTNSYDAGNSNMNPYYTYAGKQTPDPVASYNQSYTQNQVNQLPQVAHSQPDKIQNPYIPSQLGSQSLYQPQLETGATGTNLPTTNYQTQYAAVPAMQTGIYTAYSQSDYMPANQDPGYMAQSTGYVTDYGQYASNQYYSSAPASYSQNMSTQGIPTDMTNYGQQVQTSNVSYTNQPTTNYYAAADNGYGVGLQQQQQQPAQQLQQPQQIQQPPPDQPQYIPPYSVVGSTNMSGEQGAANVASAQPPQPRKSIDLLSEFDNIALSAPTLEPIKSERKTETPEVDKPTTTEVAQPKIEAPLNFTIKTEPKIDESLADLDLSLGYIETQTATLNVNTVDLGEAVGNTGTDAGAVTTSNSTTNSTANIENFIKEFQRLEKTINSLTTKTLNGTTPLETKWKDLHDALVRRLISYIIALLHSFIFCLFLGRRKRMPEISRFLYRNSFRRKTVACCMSRMITLGFCCQLKLIIILMQRTYG